MWSCGSLTFLGQVWKKTLPFILVSTSAQVCKGYPAKCYGRHKWQACAPRCSGLLLHTKSAKDITDCWWCSKGQYICYLICLFDFTEPFNLPLLSEAQKKAAKLRKKQGHLIWYLPLENVASVVLTSGQNGSCWMELSWRGSGTKWHNWIMERMCFCEMAQETVQT